MLVQRRLTEAETNRGIARVFADWSGLALFFVIWRLVYYPPYHSKYNPIECC